MKYLFVLIGMLFIVACGDPNSNEAPAEDPAAKTNESPKAKQVQLSGDQIKLAEIETGPLPKRRWQYELQVNGEVVVLPQSKSVVHAPATAYISDLRVKEGDAVRKGERLAWLQHPDFLQLQQELLELKARLPYLKNEVQRQEELAQTEAGPRKKAEAAAAEYQSKTAQYQGIKARLEWLGIEVKALEENGAFQKRIALRAPAAGKITHQIARTGQLAQPQDRLFEITQLQAPKVQLLVYAKDLARVKKGQSVEFHLLGQSQKYQARILQIVPQIEGEEQAAKVWIQPEEKLDLIPGMRLRANILSEGQTRYVLPKDAVIERDGRHFAFIKEKEGFGLTPVQIVDENQDWLAVEAAADKTFVLKGGYYLREQF